MRPLWPWPSQEGPQKGRPLVCQERVSQAAPLHTWETEAPGGTGTLIYSHSYSSTPPTEESESSPPLAGLDLPEFKPCLHYLVAVRPSGKSLCFCGPEPPSLHGGDKAAPDSEDCGEKFLCANCCAGAHTVCSTNVGYCNRSMLRPPHLPTERSLP